MNDNNIRKILEKRKYNLTETLQNGREEIDLTRQHQLYGAIKELDNMLNAIDYREEEDIKTNYDLNLSNEQNSSIMEKVQRISLKLKKSFKVTK